MSLKPNDFLIYAIGGNQSKVVLGKEQEITFKIKNTSLVDKAYNISFSINMPDGLQLIDTSIPILDFEVLENNSIIYNFFNIEDLNPDEEEYTFKILYKSLTTFTDGSEVNFKTSFNLGFSFFVDTLPRGNFDVGNEVIVNTLDISVFTEKFMIKDTSPIKKVKGAGEINTKAAWSFEKYIEITNNSKEKSIFSIEELLDDGLRFLEIVSISNKNLKEPSIIINDTNKTLINWKNIELEPDEVLLITYNIAIWNKFSQNNIQNEGELIEHLTKLFVKTSAISSDFSIEKISEITAMDIIIEILKDEKTFDVNLLIHYISNIYINQYFDMKNIVAYMILPDGQKIQNSFTGKKEPDTNNFKTVVKYDIGDMLAGTSSSITLISLVKDIYTQNNEYIYCNDNFLFECSIIALNPQLETLYEDFDNLSLKILKPYIKKTILSVTDRNGNLKQNNIVSINDIIKYELSYSSVNTNARQKNIIIEDYFPYMIDMPLEKDIVTLTGPSFLPQTVYPNGLRWNLGDLLPNTIWVTTVICKINALPKNNYFFNLLKLSGENILGINYSARDYVKALYGKPNLQISREITGIDKNAIESSQLVNVKIRLKNKDTPESSTAHNFSLTEFLPKEIIVDPNTLEVYQTGIDNSIIDPKIIDSSIVDNKIIINIDKLDITQNIFLIYKANIIQDIAPNTKVNFLCETSVPYSQEKNPDEENIQFKMEKITNRMTLSAKNVTFALISDTDIKEIGSIANYEIKLTIPKGTTARKLQLKNELPIEQIYINEVSLNNININPTILNTIMDFPEILELKATNKDEILEYKFSAKIIDDISLLENYEQISNTICKFLDNNSNDVFVYGSISLNVSIPLLQIKTFADDNFLNDYNQKEIKIEVKNPTTIDANTIKIILPLHPKFSFRSSKTTNGSIFYDNITKTITWYIKNVDAFELQTAKIYLLPLKNIEVNEQLNIISQIESYYGKASKYKKYPKIFSEPLILICKSKISLDINKIYKISTGKGKVFASQKRLKIIDYKIKNLGAGIDKLILTFTKSKYPCNIYINKKNIGILDLEKTIILTDELLQNVLSAQVLDLDLYIKVPLGTPLFDENPINITLSSALDNLSKVDFMTTIIDP